VGKIKMLMGSTAQQVLLEVDCPVLAVTVKEDVRPGP
jgi:nucleotide-binding universal stress UspA family protein